MQTLPNVLSVFVDKMGKIVQPWIGYLQQFTIPPPAFSDIDVDPSPFVYEATEPGFIYISGGTVSAITLTRGTDTLTIASDTSIPRLVPVAIKDIVSVTYSVLPTMKYIESYGQHTTS